MLGESEIDLEELAARDWHTARDRRPEDMRRPVSDVGGGANQLVRSMREVCEVCAVCEVMV